MKELLKRIARKVFAILINEIVDIVGKRLDDPNDPYPKGWSGTSANSKNKG